MNAAALRNGTNAHHDEFLHVAQLFMTNNNNKKNTVFVRKLNKMKSFNFITRFILTRNKPNKIANVCLGFPSREQQTVHQLYMIRLNEAESPPESSMPFSLKLNLSFKYTTSLIPNR